MATAHEAFATLFDARGAPVRTLHFPTLEPVEGGHLEEHPAPAVHAPPYGFGSNAGRFNNVEFGALGVVDDKVRSPVRRGMSAF